MSKMQDKSDKHSSILGKIPTWLGVYLFLLSFSLLNAFGNATYFEIMRRDRLNSKPKTPVLSIRISQEPSLKSDYLLTHSKGEPCRER